MAALTFKKGTFWLTAGEKKTRVSLKAAMQMRGCADEKTKALLESRFVKFYPYENSGSAFHFLDDHQKEGVKWILSRSRSYLAHCAGAGKTAQAILGAEFHFERTQILIIVPPSLTLNWKREIQKVTTWIYGEPQPNGSIAIVPQSIKAKTMNWDAEYVICSDSMLTREWVIKNILARDWSFVAVDEASRFKEATSQRTIALFGGVFKPKGSSKAYNLPGVIRNARHAVLLDGSPMPNRAMELWAPTYAMSPESIDFMEQQDFGFKYCGATLDLYGHWEFKHTTNAEELNVKLTKSFMHVVKEEELNHPERRRSMLVMSTDVRSRAHRDWESKSLRDLKLESTVLSESTSEGVLATYRHELGLKKVPWIVDYVSERLEKGESIVLYAWHRDVCEELYRLILAKADAGIVYGGTPEKIREEIFASFQSGKTKVIIGNIQAMGRGHNLQRADRVIFGEFSWTDELNKQCEKRVSRRGNEKAVTPCNYIVCPGSMDEIVLTSVFNKAKAVEKVIN